MLLLLMCFTCVTISMVLLISCCYYYGHDVDIVVLHNIQILNYSFVVDVMVLLSYLCKCSIENYVHFHLNLPPNFPPNYLLNGNTITKHHGWIQLSISITQWMFNGPLMTMCIIETLVFFEVLRGHQLFK